MQMDQADFRGRSPNVFENNIIHSSVPSMIRSNGGLRFDHNLYWVTGHREPRWHYDGREWVGLPAYRQGTGQDGAGFFADPKLTATLRLLGGSPAIDAGASPGGDAVGDAFGTSVPRGPAPDIGAVERDTRGWEGSAAGRGPASGHWTLVAHLTDDDASRAQVVFLQAAAEQFGEKGLVVAAVFRDGLQGDLQHDWDSSASSAFFGRPERPLTSACTSPRLSGRPMARRSAGGRAWLPRPIPRAPRSAP